MCNKKDDCYNFEEAEHSINSIWHDDFFEFIQ